MKNTQSLLDLVARAERGALLPGEAQILRDAIQSLAELTDMVNRECGCATGQIPVVKIEVQEPYCARCGKRHGRGCW